MTEPPQSANGHDHGRDRRPLWTGRELIDAAGAEQIAGPGDGWSAHGVCYYPDKVQTGDLVLTTSRERWGRRFADTAAQIPELAGHGAAVILTDDPPAGLQAPAHLPLLRVPDTRAALDALAEAARLRFSGRVICIAGTRGRSLTRRALFHALGSQAATFANEKGYDRALGIARSLAQTPPDCPYGLYEMATRTSDTTLASTRLLRPHVAVVTSVRRLKERLSSREVATLMALMFDGLEPGSIVVLDRDSRYCDRLMLAAVEHGATSVVTFGSSPDSDVCRLDSATLSGVSRVRARVHGTPVTMSVPLVRDRHVMHVLAALATVHALGADCRLAAESLASLPASSARGESALPEDQDRR